MRGIGNKSPVYGIFEPVLALPSALEGNLAWTGPDYYRNPLAQGEENGNLGPPFGPLAGQLVIASNFIPVVTGSYVPKNAYGLQRGLR